MAPPKPQAENVPRVSTLGRTAWRPGYWWYDQDNNKFDWVPGQLMAKPNPTAVWSPDRWEEHTYGWAFIPGYWQ